MDDPRMGRDAGSGDPRARLTPTLIVRLRAEDVVHDVICRPTSARCCACATPSSYRAPRAR